MRRLLIYRVVPLSLRPLAILFEGMLPGEASTLVLSLPIAMLVVTLSAIPVHIDHYKRKGFDRSGNVEADRYLSSLLFIVLCAVLALSIALTLPVFEFSILFVFVCCLFYLSEKFFDEASRSLEFDKRFGSWFYIQLLRSGWVFVPLALAYSGYDYRYVFLGALVFVVALSIIVFFQIMGFRFQWQRDFLNNISSHSVYFIGSFIPASSRQLPRIVIVNIYPDFAHVFLAMAQLAQGAGIVFNVRYQIPYRKLIARRPFMFQRLYEPIMRLWLIFPFLCLIFYGCYIMFLPFSQYPAHLVVLFLFPIVFSDVVLFSVLSNHLGYIQWTGRRLKALGLYALCLSFGGLVVLSMYVFDYLTAVNLSGVLVGSMTVSFVWLILIKYIFFVFRS